MKLGFNIIISAPAPGLWKQTDIDNWTFEGAELSWCQKVFSTKKEMTENMVNEVDIKLTRLITDVENIGKDNTKNLI